MALGAVVIISLFSLILILFSIKTYIRGQIEDQRFFLEQTKKEHEKSDIKDFQEIIKKYNKTLAELNYPGSFPTHHLLNLNFLK